MYKAINASYNGTMMREQNTLQLTRREAIQELFSREMFVHNVFTPFNLCEDMVRMAQPKGAILVFNPEFAVVLIEDFGVTPSDITLYADEDPSAERVATSLGINYIRAWCYKMKFDTIIGNPPYEGQRSLHQKFFNNSVDLLKDGGTICFIQPAVVYHNKKSNVRQPTQEMRDNISKHTTSVRFVDGRVFENALIAGQCSITVLHKDNSNNGIISTVTTMSGEVYHDVELKYINQQEMEISIYKSLVDKITGVVDNQKSLHELISRDDDTETFCIQKIRGNTGQADFYTFVSNNPEYQKMHKGFGLLIKPDEFDGMLSYMKTYIARFALSINKYSVHLYASELGMVPQVDFSQEWSDEKLMAEWGITEEEYAEILKVIPAYYD